MRACVRARAHVRMRVHVRVCVCVCVCVCVRACVALCLWKALAALGGLVLFLSALDASECVCAQHIVLNVSIYTLILFDHF